MNRQYWVIIIPLLLVGAAYFAVTNNEDHVNSILYGIPAGLHPLLPGEVVNATSKVSIPHSLAGEQEHSDVGVAFLPTGAGNYSIYTTTTGRFQAAYIAYTYEGTESHSDRFGTYSTTYTHGWGIAQPGQFGYLGETDVNNVVNTTFSIPADAITPRIIIDVPESYMASAPTTATVDITVRRLN